jgi:hypothetical protein
MSWLRTTLQQHLSTQHTIMQELYLAFPSHVLGEAKDLSVLHSTLDKISDRDHILGSENSEVHPRQRLETPTAITSDCPCIGFELTECISKRTVCLGLRTNEDGHDWTVTSAPPSMLC